MHCTELLCHVKSKKSADLAVAFLCLFALHLYLLFNFFDQWCLTSGASDPAFLSVCFEYCHVCSFQFLDLVPLISYMFSSSALHLIQSNSFISLFLCLLFHSRFTMYFSPSSLHSVTLCPISRSTTGGGVLLVCST